MRQGSRYGSVRSGYRKHITTSRSTSATTTIQNNELRPRPVTPGSTEFSPPELGSPGFRLVVLSKSVSEEVIRFHRDPGTRRVLEMSFYSATTEHPRFVFSSGTHLLSRLRLSRLLRSI